MEKQEFCMEKSQIFQEMISRISKLSQDSYLMVTDMRSEEHTSELQSR